MLSRLPLSAALLTAALLAGCGGQPGNYWPPPRPLGAELATTRPTVGDVRDQTSPSPFIQPTGVLRLRDALALALARNPELAGSAISVRQAEADRMQAALPPNPELEVEFESFAGSGEFRGSRSLETALAISQVLELGGKRPKREALATHDGRLAGWDYEAKRLAVLTDVARRFVAALAVSENLKLTEQTLLLTEATFEAVSKRVAAGKASGVEKTKATVEVATARMAVRRTRRQFAAARQQLAAGWGAETVEFGDVVGNLEDLPPVADHDALAAGLIDNPEIARWPDELAQRQAAVDLAKSGAIPDVAAGIGYRRAGPAEGHDQALLVVLAVSLPVFDRNQGEVRRARLDLLKARNEQRAAAASVRAEFEEAYQELAAAHEEAVSLRDEILPAAKRSFETSEQAFKQGKSDYLEVLDAQRTLIEARELYVEALAAYHTAAAGVEGIVGRPLNSAGKAAALRTEDNNNED